MPTLVNSSLELPASPVPRRKRWNREQCAELESRGLFKNEKLELVDGELISKMGKNRGHVNAFRILLLWLQDTFGRELVDAEAPIDVRPEDNSTNEPEPDLIVLNREGSTFLSANPQPADIRLVVEISDSTLNYDLSAKASLYARAGIVEYWVIDVAGKQLFCHREPSNGNYKSIQIYSQQESVAPLSAPGIAFPLAKLLGVKEETL